MSRSTKSISLAGPVGPQIPDGFCFPETGIMPGHKAPQFEEDCLHNGKIEKFSLQDLTFNGGGEESTAKWALILFYPVDFDYIAPTELGKVQEYLNDLEVLNCVPVAVSPSSLFVKKAFVKTPVGEGGAEGVSFRLVEDKGRKIADLYDIKNTDRAITILDDEGIVQVRMVCDLPIGLRIKEAVRLVRACKASKDQNVATGAGWQPDMEVQERIPFTIEQLMFPRLVNIPREHKD